MDRNLTQQVIVAGANEVSIKAMRDRRRNILDYIDAVEANGEQIPTETLQSLLGELFDLNIAIGDVPFDDKDQA